MGKKKNIYPKKILSKKNKKSKSNTIYLSAAFIAFVILTGYMISVSADKDNSSRVVHDSSGANLNNIKLKEIRSVLPASLWRGRIAEAYRIASRIPEVIDAQYCNCDCSKNPRFKHKTLLTCFTDDHGANCDICMNEVFLADKLHKKGLSIPEIKQEVDKMFSKYSHG